MIRMKRFSRSSRPTGPKMRVPRGSPPSRISTAAFSSKRIYEPSTRRRSLRVRTTTALTTSPRLTPAPGRASFTVATMTSPMPAYRRPEPPSTRMHKISLAPVLSATLSRDSCWITSTPASSRSACVANHRGHLLGLLQDFRYPPPPGRGQRPGLHQQHPVADAAGVVGVVRGVLLRAPDDLAVLGVLDPVLGEHHDGLVHLVADHEPLAGLAVRPPLVPGRLGLAARLRVTHCPAPPRAVPHQAGPHQAGPHQAGPHQQSSRCRARARASPCRSGRSPCGRRAAARGSPAAPSPPGSEG